MELIEFTDFQKVQMVVGTIIGVKPNAKARVPAYILEIDFGQHGIKTSSAQLTENYAIEDLQGMQIVAVLNFPAKRVAGVKSEVLILGAIATETGTVLLAPTKAVPNGSSIA